MSNINLNKANKAKKDEFYTRYEDIEKELINYDKSLFEDKVLYCPCDTSESNFVKYLENNRDIFGYKELIHTSLQEGFDFRSDYCQSLFAKADIVITNPPFSLFREFIAILEHYKLKYLILGNMNACTYKEILPLLKDNKLWYGASIHSGDRVFDVPNDYDLNASGCGTNADGSRYIKVKGVRWFTNLDYSRRHTPILLVKSYNGNDYPKLDNYDAINVNSYKDIPKDYAGIMAVPITIFDFYCPEQFEIIGHMASTTITDTNYGYPYLNGKKLYARILIRRKVIL